MQKLITTTEHLESAAKYSGSSLTIALAVVQIVVFVFPNLEPITEALYALVAFFINLALVYIIKEKKVE